MGMLLRMQVLTATVVTIAAVALVWGELQQPLYNKVTPGGEYAGFMSDMIANLGTVLPLVLAGLLLGIVLWLFYGQVQEERTVRRRP